MNEHLQILYINCVTFVAIKSRNQYSIIVKGVGMELALRSILPVEAFIQLRMAAHRGFFPFPVS